MQAAAAQQQALQLQSMIGAALNAKLCCCRLLCGSQKLLP